MYKYSTLTEFYQVEKIISGSFLIRINNDGRSSYVEFETIDEYISQMISKISRSDSFQYHEVMIEDRRRKMYFDVDISGDVDIQLANNFINLLLECLTSYILTIDECRDLTRDYILDRCWIYTSHNIGSKLSYHIIVGGISYDRRDLKYRTGQIIDNLARIISGDDQISDHYSISSSSCNIEDLMRMKIEWIDRMVYNKNQCLRTVGSTKDGRTKIFSNIWMYSGKLKVFNLDTADIIRNSIVTLCDKCIIVKPHPESIRLDKIVSSYDPDDVLIREIESHIHPVFEIRDVKSGIVILNRKQSSYCQICDRFHAENTKGDNPYITMSNLGDLVQIRFHCRRKSGHIVLFTTGLTKVEYVTNMSKYIYNHNLEYLEYINSLNRLFLS